jgi:putative transposase
MLEYKAESAGVQVVKVEARNTTQICGQCGNVVKKSLAVRTHRCSCGFIADRDYNAALNILRQGLSEFTPVETEPLLLSNREQVQSQKQEAPCESVV